MRIEVTWEHEQGYKYNQRYKTVGGFVRAYKSGKQRLVNAVDYTTLYVITRDNIKEYISLYCNKLKV